MLRALDPDEARPPTAYRVPWRIDRSDPRHPLVTNDGGSPVDSVRVFLESGRSAVTEHWGRMQPGETGELCLCDADPDDILVTVAWFRPEGGEEYLWRFTV